MATTPLGIPKFALTDNADIAAKLNALADSTDGLLTTRSFVVCAHRVTRVDSTKYTATSAADRLITGFGNNAYDTGGIGYAAGIYTVPTTGLYHAELQGSWPSQSGTGLYSRSIGFYRNGARTTDGLDVKTVAVGEGGRTYTTGGDVVLTAGDTLQPYLRTTGPDEDVLVFSYTLRRVG